MLSIVNWLLLIFNIFKSFINFSKTSSGDNIEATNIGIEIRLVNSRKKLIIFASHSFDDDGNLEVGNITVYPRSVVKKIERLKWHILKCLKR